MNNSSKIISNIVKFIIIFAGLIILISMYFLLNTKPTKLINIENNHKVEIGGNFTLIDQKGEIFDSSKLDGKYSLIYFGFTYCPDICPDSLQKITNVLDTLKSYNISIVPLFITIDPKRDTTEVLKEYTKHFHEDFVALTGTEDQIKEVTKLFKVYYQVAPEKENTADYMIDHSAFVYLMDKSGNYLAHFDTAEKSDVITHKIVKLLKAQNAF